MSNKFKWYSSFSNYVQHLQRNLWDNRNITKSFIVVSGVTAHRVQCTLTVKHLKLQFFFLAIQNFNSVLNKDSDFSVYDKLYNDNAFLDALRNVKDFLSIRTFFNRGDHRPLKRSWKHTTCYMFLLKGKYRFGSNIVKIKRRR